jgi:hypothetical protein
LEEGSEIELVFSLRKNFVFLVFGSSGSDQIQDGCLSEINGQDGVKGKDTALLCQPTKDSTGDCGSPEPGSKTTFPRAPASSKAVGQKCVENPGPGPEERKTQVKPASIEREGEK